MRRNNPRDRTVALTGVEASGKVGTIPYTNVRGMALTREANARGGRHSGATRRSQNHDLIADIRLAVTRSVEGGQSIRGAVQNYLKKHHESDWTGLSAPEQKRRIDNLTRDLRRK